MPSTSTVFPAGLRHAKSVRWITETGSSRNTVDDCLTAGFSTSLALAAEAVRVGQHYMDLRHGVHDGFTNG